ncbi:O-methyltransferase [Lachnellula hyalina]|uniref:O-methyltransferase n=1 Tax=Lachnellula hyalina TaxID=1316788 RepID=A0A8H8R6F5_9HELO|nr:O-methyltransferase [Lachnellula hyalina]TVY28476.1 O-methyltransferase [Lachnellula hyalina]
MTSPSITELAVIISENTAKVNEYLLAKELPLPSFNVDAPNKPLIDPQECPDVEAARIKIIDASLMMRDLMLGPKGHLMSFNHDSLLSMQAISQFNLVSTIPIHGEATFGEIAEKSGVNEGDVKRILRHAMTNRIFKEPSKGLVAHTAASRLIAEDTQMADWVGASTGELWQAAAQTVHAMLKYPGSQEPNETGFSLANNSDKSTFAILSQDPKRAKRFGNAMRAYTEGTGFDLQYVADNYPWADFGNGTVVDVGGSHGSACITLATAFPKLNLVVQDLPQVVAGGPATLPLDMANKIEFMAYDFLKEQQPVKDADVYFFRWVFHNWSDKYCILILRNHIPALKKGARIVINEYVLPEPGVLPIYQEERLRSMDLTMMEVQNSRERDLDDWAKLFREADERFVFKGGKQPEGSSLWILEVEWK